MYSVSEAISTLKGLVGWEQPANPLMPAIDADNKTATSGLFFNDNNLVTIEALKDSQEYKDISVLQFNTLLKRIQERSIISVCNGVFDDASFIQSGKYLTGRLRFEKTDTLQTGFVGYQFMIEEQHIAFEIKTLYLSFQNSGTLKLLLFDAEKL